MAKKKKGNLRCPECGFTLSRTEHYDESYEWFECPGCDGCFTEEEMQKGGLEEHTDSRRTEITSDKPKAKGKKGKEKKKAEPPVKVGITSTEVINIMADEIQTIYEEMGRPLDYANSRDKALQIFRVMQYDAKGTFHDKPVNHILCKGHS